MNFQTFAQTAVPIHPTERFAPLEDPFAPGGEACPKSLRVHQVYPAAFAA